MCARRRRTQPQNLHRLANLLDEHGTAGATAEAEALHREVVQGRTAHYGAAHVETLQVPALALAFGRSVFCEPDLQSCISEKT